ncbi:Cthe_2314 family HEPN domain-containing protein [Bacillus cereus]|nr:Cthe_2314 family HEPN domain-containing protein [Bacillus cereus]
MTVHIELFEYPTKEEMLALLKDSPLNKLNLDEALFRREGLNPMEQLDYSITIGEMLNLYQNRVFQANLSYAYVMSYFNRGIPDDEWFRSKATGGVKYYPDFKNEHWTNKIHFEYHIDVFFQKAFTVLDIFGHLLFKYFDLTQEKKHGRLQDITFNNAFWNLKHQRRDISLHKKMGKIKFSNRYKEVSKIRNAIIHSQPPYVVHNRFETEEGVATTRIHYTPSRELVEDMCDLSKFIQRIVEIFSKHITEKHKGIVR